MPHAVDHSGAQRRCIQCHSQRHKHLLIAAAAAPVHRLPLSSCCEVGQGMHQEQLHYCSLGAGAACQYLAMLLKHRTALTQNLPHQVQKICECSMPACQ
jgi:hypothetical protein